MHYDAAFAATTRSKRLIASGTHTTAFLLGLTASHSSQHGAMVGLEFWLRFRRPIYADETIRLAWLVVRVTPKAKLRGEVVELRGRLIDQNGVTALGGKGQGAGDGSAVKAGRTGTGCLAANRASPGNDLFLMGVANLLQQEMSGCILPTRFLRHHAVRRRRSMPSRWRSGRG